MNSLVIIIGVYLSDVARPSIRGESWEGARGVQVYIYIFKMKAFCIWYAISSYFSFEARLINRYWGEHFLKLVLNCCVSGPELLRASLIYISAQQFRT